MRNLFKICPKYNFSKFLRAFKIAGRGRGKGVSLIKKWKRGCSIVSETKWKILCLNSGIMGIFHI